MSFFVGTPPSIEAHYALTWNHTFSYSLNGLQGGTSFLGILCFFSVLCASVYLCLVVTCRERADLLTLVCGV